MTGRVRSKGTARLLWGTLAVQTRERTAEIALGCSGLLWARLETKGCLTLWVGSFYSVAFAPTKCPH